MTERLNESLVITMIGKMTNLTSCVIDSVSLRYMVSPPRGIDGFHLDFFEV